MDKQLTNFRILTQETKAALEKRIGDELIKVFFAKAKAATAEDSGAFKVIISTENTDRHGDVILVDGWDLSFFEKNPVVLWAHDYSALPIGMCTKVYKDGKQLVAEGIFAPAEANPVGQQVRRLYDLGMMNATSIGAIVLEQTGNVISKAELLEFSFVPVPANPYALRLSELGEDVKEFVAKGLMVEESATRKRKTITELECKDCNAKLTNDNGELFEVENAQGGSDLVPLCEACADKRYAAESGEEKTKGAVADELNGNQDIQEKYKKLDEMFEAIYAMINVYLMGVTPASDFNKLLAELAQIFIAMAGEVAAEGTVKAAKEAMTPEMRQKTITDIVKRLAINKTVAEEVGALLSELQAGVDKIIIDKSKAILEAVGVQEAEKQKEIEGGVNKEGRVLSKKNRDLITNTIEPLKASTAALEELLKATDPEGDEPQDSPDGDEVKKGRNAKGSASLAKQMEEWQGAQQVLRDINNITSGALEKINLRRKNKS